jgi:hypothetical protein
MKNLNYKAFTIILIGIHCLEMQKEKQKMPMNYWNKLKKQLKEDKKQ